jgi:hypothetical protein
MTTATTVSRTPRDPELLGQTVVGIGGSADIGLETARSARADVAALAVHIMSNTALTGATYDIDGRQQLVPGHWRKLRS